MLKLFAQVLPKPNKCPTSYYKLKKYFNDGDDTYLKSTFIVQTVLSQRKTRIII